MKRRKTTLPLVVVSKSPFDMFFIADVNGSLNFKATFAIRKQCWVTTQQMIWIIGRSLVSVLVVWPRSCIFVNIFATPSIGIVFNWIVGMCAVPKSICHKFGFSYVVTLDVNQSIA